MSLPIANFPCCWFPLGKGILTTQVYFGISTPFSSLSLFTPAITSGLGYTNLRAQLMTVPPWAVAYVVTTVVAWSADHFNRYVHRVRQSLHYP